MKDVKLNRFEVWVADHAAPILAVIAILIVVGAGVTFYVWQQQGDTAKKVKTLAPQVTRINEAICDRRSLSHPARARRCAERIRVGLVNCRHVSRCRAAWLALATYPPPARGATSGATAGLSSPSTSSPAPGDSGGGGAQQPSHGHQPPSPGSQPGPESASPSPGAAPAPEPGPPASTPGNGPQNGSGGGSSSGAGVEVCAVKTCVGAEVNVPGL